MNRVSGNKIYACLGVFKEKIFIMLYKEFKY